MRYSVKLVNTLEMRAINATIIREIVYLIGFFISFRESNACVMMKITWFTVPRNFLTKILIFLKKDFFHEYGFSSCSKKTLENKE